MQESEDKIIKKGLIGLKKATERSVEKGKQFNWLITRNQQKSSGTGRY